MKVLSFLVLIAIFSVMESSIPGFSVNKQCSDFFNPANPDVEEKQAYSKDFCRSLHVTDSSHKCCYLKYKKNDKTYFNCVEVTEAEFWDIDAKIDSLKIKNSMDVKKLVCDSSSYLYGSLLLILFALF